MHAVTDIDIYINDKSFIYKVSTRAYKRRGHATVHEQKPNGRRNVTGKVQ